MAYKDSLILYLKMILLCGIIYLILILIPQLCIDKRNTILISIIIVGCVYILYINNNNINELYTNNNVTHTLIKNPPDYKNDEINPKIVYYTLVCYFVQDTNTISIVFRRSIECFLSKYILR